MIEFHLDQFSAGFLAGWARGDGDEPLLLTLSIDRKPIIVRKEANAYRSDLHEAGLGSGCFGFSFIPKEAIKAGQNVEVSDDLSGEILFSADFKGAIHPGLIFALEAAEAFPVIAQPYWQSTLVRRDNDILLAGTLCLPPGTDISDVKVVDCDTASSMPIMISPPHYSSNERLWFVPGEIHDATLSVTICERRQRLGVVISHELFRDEDLNFAIVPSEEDFRGFKFAGAERARRVAGSADTLHLFAAGGVTQATQILDIAKTISLPVDARVLDWGCGAARVAQFVAVDRPRWRLVGADIDEVNIKWCEENVSGIDFNLLDLVPPTPYATSTFDFIYGLSVITHLQKAIRDAWLVELRRIVKPGGYVLLTYMGVWAALQCGRHDAAMDVYASLASRGISDDLKDYALGNELSSYYRATYNTRDELLGILGMHFDVIKEFPRSLCYQDAVLLRKC